MPLLLAGLGANASGLFGEALVPILDLACGELRDSVGAERRQDMRLGGPPRIVHRLAAATLVRLEVIVNGIFDRERSGPRVMPFLTSQLSLPPLTGGLLCSGIVEH